MPSPDRRILVTYSIVPSFELWQKIQPELVSHLPLQNLQWHPANRSIRNIDSLHLDLRNIGALSDDLDKSTTDILQRPYLHLLFVSCEDSDVYRSQIRHHIRSWLDDVKSKRSIHEWLIIQVTSVRLGPSKFYQRKSTVLDKIKADFNSSKKDRCLQLLLTGEPNDIPNWLELLTKIKDAIVTVFDQNITTYEEDLKRIDSQRTMPGWNFCTFFIQKVCLCQTKHLYRLIDM